ncbi:MAG: NAD(P)-binding domain-containing protein [Anaerolineae bacterium]|nr:NAD(P)-binding domain-containing protein [Anaerolineae bacterium]
MTVIYREEHADVGQLAGKTVSVIGYGSLGRPMALRLHDSGVQLLVGARSNESRAAATDDGIPAVTVEEAVKRSDIIMMMLPNEIMPPFYLEYVSPHLRKNQMLVFGSAYTLTYNYIEPPPFVDVGLIAPRSMASAIAEGAGDDYMSFVSVGQDSSGSAWPLLLALAKSAGALRVGAVEISFERETELDLFMHQAVLPALHHVLTTAAELLLARGYPTEAVFAELYLSGELGDYLKQAAQRGLLTAFQNLPLNGQYGAYSRLERFDDLKLERLMEISLKEIHNGDFAREWSKEYADGYRRLKNFFKNQSKLELWELEKQSLEFFGRDTDSDR